MDEPPIRRPRDPVRRSWIASTRDARYVCWRCGFTGNLSQIGEHWLRRFDHAPDFKAPRDE